MWYIGLTWVTQFVARVHKVKFLANIIKAFPHIYCIRQFTDQLISLECHYQFEQIYHYFQLVQLRFLSLPLIRYLPAGVCQDDVSHDLNKDGGVSNRALVFNPDFEIELARSNLQVRVWPELEIRCS